MMAVLFSQSFRFRDLRPAVGDEEPYLAKAEAQKAAPNQQVPSANVIIGIRPHPPPLKSVPKSLLNNEFQPMRTYADVILLLLPENKIKKKRIGNSRPHTPAARLSS